MTITNVSLFLNVLKELTLILPLTNVNLATVTVLLVGTSSVTLVPLVNLDYSLLILTVLNNVLKEL